MRTFEWAGSDRSGIRVGTMGRELACSPAVRSVSAISHNEVSRPGLSGLSARSRRRARGAGRRARGLCVRVALVSMLVAVAAVVPGAAQAAPVDLLTQANVRIDGAAGERSEWVLGGRRG